MHKTITHGTVEVEQKHWNTLPSVLIQKLYSSKTLFFFNCYYYFSTKIIILLILQGGGDGEKERE